MNTTLSKLFATSGMVVVILLSTLLLSSCDKTFVPKEESEDHNAFSIVSTQLEEITFKGGSGVITLSSAPESVSAEQPWVTVTASGTTINVTVEPNTDYDSRTTKILIAKGDDLLIVPVTQLGTINIVTLVDSEFPAVGATYGFAFKPGEDYSLTGFDDTPWLSYEMRNDSIFFTAEENGLFDPARSVTGHLTVGKMIDRDVTITQAQYELAYAMLPGTYTMTYTNWVGNDRSTLEGVTIREFDKAKNQLLVVMPNYAFVAVFDPINLTLNIKGQQVTNSLSKSGVWLAPWEGNNGGNLWPNSKFGIRGIWDGNKQFPTFTYEPDGVTDETWISADGNPVIVHGFILWSQAEEGSLQPSRLIDPILTRTGDLPTAP